LHFDYTAMVYFMQLIETAHLVFKKYAVSPFIIREGGSGFEISKLPNNQNNKILSTKIP